MAAIKKRFCERYSCQLIRHVVLSIVLAGFSAGFVQDWYRDNSDAATILATVLSILAGFLIAVMAIAGDDRSLRGRTWKQDTFYVEEAKRQLTRYRMMFFLYMTVLVLLFAVSLSKDWAPTIREIVEWLAMFLAIIALLLSFRLPGDLTARQLTQLQKLVDDRRKNEGSGGGPPA